MKLAVMRLVRVLNDHKYGTFGVLKINESWMCVTLEPPDKLNKANISCIPTGQYYCEKIVSPKFGNTWTVTGVTDRGNILFHPGNRVPDTQGCIITAESFNKLMGELAVLNSGKTFKAFLDVLAEFDRAHLTVSEAF